MAGISALALSILLITPLSAQNKAPFTIPELREWQGGMGSFKMSDRIGVVGEGDAATVAGQFRDDLEEIYDWELRESARKGAGMVRFLIDPAQLTEEGREAYLIQIESDQVVVTANDPLGLFWGSRSLLQMMEQSHDLPVGIAKDYPLYPMRGFMLDVGRKYFPIDFLEDVVEMMSYYKMNTFQVHLNDNGFKVFHDEDWSKTQAAFRLESDVYPGLTARDGSYSKEEFRAFQKEALKRGVTIIPEIDAPAHTLAFARFMPELASKGYGDDHLDLFNPKTYEVMDKLWDEYLEGDDPVFVGEVVHIGTDEYSNKDQKVVEQFRAFTERYIQKVKSYGKTPMLWGSLTHASGSTPVSVEGVLMHLWSKDYADPQEMVKLGYDVLNIPDNKVYIVPAAGYYYDYLNLPYLYKEWTPAVATNHVFEEQHPQVKGSMFAVWNDHPDNGISLYDVYHRMFPAMQVIAAKSWSGEQVSYTLEQFEEGRLRLSEGVDQNVLLRPDQLAEGLFFESETPVQGEELDAPLDGIGYNYRVSFDLVQKPNPKGTLLFEMDDEDETKFYLTDPINGRMGFARNGHIFDFGTYLPLSRELRVTVEGNYKSTTLYVDGEKVAELPVIPHPDDVGRSRTRYLVRTLVFPLEKMGRFNGSLTNLRVEYLGLGEKY